MVRIKRPTICKKPYIMRLFYSLMKILSPANGFCAYAYCSSRQRQISVVGGRVPGVVGGPMCR